MSWKPRPKQYYNDEDEYSNHYNNYNNRSPRQYHSHSNYQYHNNNTHNHNYNRSNYNRNAYYQNNRQYMQYKHNHNNQYSRYNQYNQQNSNQNNYYNQNNFNQNNNNQKWVNKNSSKVKHQKNTGKYNIVEIPFNELKSTLQFIWNKQYTKNVQYIEKIIFLCGPPGSGKTSISNYVEKYYNLNTLNHNEYMIDVSDLLSIVMKENNRALIISKVYELLFKHILQNIKQNKILIIDGFLRKEQHVFVTHFLQLQMKHTSFIFLVINVDENTSVKRQLERGQKLLKLANNTENDNDAERNGKKIRLKDSDLYEHAARYRYQKYNKLLQSVRYQLRNHMKAQFNIIDATKPLKNVYQRVEIQLETQDKQQNQNNTNDSKQ